MDTIILQAEFLRGKRKMSEEEEAAEDLMEARRSMEEASGSSTTTGSNQAGGKRRPSESSLSNKSPVASSSSSHSKERSPSTLGESPGSFGMLSPTGSLPIKSPNNLNAMPKSPEFEGSSRLWAKTTHPLSLSSDSTLPEVHSVLHTTYPFKDLKTYVFTETELFSCSQVKTEVEDLPLPRWSREVNVGHQAAQELGHQAGQQPGLGHQVGLGQEAAFLQRLGSQPLPVPWSHQLQKPDFFSQPSNYRPSLLHQHILTTPQPPTNMVESASMMEHRPFDHPPFPSRPPEREHRSSSSSQSSPMPELILKSKGDLVSLILTSI